MDDTASPVAEEKDRPGIFVEEDGLVGMLFPEVARWRSSAVAEDVCDMLNCSLDEGLPPFYCKRSASNKEVTADGALLVVTVSCFWSLASPQTS